MLPCFPVSFHCAILHVQQKSKHPDCFKHFYEAILKPTVSRISLILPPHFQICSPAFLHRHTDCAQWPHSYAILLVVTHSGIGWAPRCSRWQASRDDHCRAGHTSHSDPRLCGEYTDTYQAPGRHIWDSWLTHFTDTCSLETALRLIQAGGVKSKLSDLKPCNW